MATNFPTSIDSLTNPVSTDTLDSPDHAVQHQNVNDAVEALETKVGVDGSTDTSSLDYLVRSASPVGAVMQFAGTASPDASWLICDGTAVSRTTYSDLFAVIGTAYGSGDGSTTFNLPNVSGRVPVGLDSGDTDFDALGETGGAKTHTLSGSEIPSHAHSIDHNHAAVTSGSGGNAHTHSINPPNTYTAYAGNHGHSGTFGSSSHKHYMQIGLHDYYYKAAGANAAMDGYGLTYYSNNFRSASQHTNTTSTVNSHSGYTTVSHGVFKSTGRTGSPDSTASVSSGGNHRHTVDIGAFTSGGASATSHTHSVDLPNFTGTSGSAGSDGAHNNVQPYIVFNWIIKAA